MSLERRYVLAAAVSRAAHFVLGPVLTGGVPSIPFWRPLCLTRMLTKVLGSSAGFSTITFSPRWVTTCASQSGFALGSGLGLGRGG